MDLERWPACHPKDVARSNYPRLRNAVDMNLSMGNTGSGDRYTTAKGTGFVGGTLDYLVRGKPAIEEGQHQLPTGVRAERRAPSPVNIRLQMSRGLTDAPTRSNINNSCDSPDFNPETAYRFTKPRMVAYKIDKTGRGAPSVGQTQQMAASPSPRDSDGVNETGAVKDFDPFAVTGGSGEFGKQGQMGPPSPTPRKVKRKGKGKDEDSVMGDAKPSDATGKDGGGVASGGGAGGGEGGEVDTCPIASRKDYETMLKNVNSIQDYYAIVKLWDIKREQQKRIERQLAGKMTADDIAKANMAADDRKGGGSPDPGRAADYAPTRWKAEEADTSRRRHRKKAPGHDFAVSAGRRSPLFFLTVDDKYRTCPWKYLDDVGAGGSSGVDRPSSPSSVAQTGGVTSPGRSRARSTSRTVSGAGDTVTSAQSGVSGVSGVRGVSREAKQPLGLQSGRPMFSPSKKMDLKTVLKNQKTKKKSRPRIPIVSTEPLDWTHPEYWNSPAAAEVGGPISDRDDFHLNPVLLSHNVTTRIPPPPLAVTTGRDSNLLGGPKERRRLVGMLREGALTADEMLNTPIEYLSKAQQRKQQQRGEQQQRAATSML